MTSPPNPLPPSPTVAGRGITQWLADFRWAMNMMRVRRMRRNAGFAARVRFDAAIRPPLGDGVIAYPDAIYRIGIEDVLRAMRATGPELFEYR